jgi:UDP-GlcNAc:undecaprenyl-phosphate GlcNAc-1-phosphate transferase
MIYGISVLLCALSLLLVNLRDGQVGLFLILLAAASVIFLRKLGYFEYVTSDKLFGWLKDLTDEAGIKRDRRTFLSLQMQIASSENIYQLWGRIIQAAKKIHLDGVTLDPHPGVFGAAALPPFTWKSGAQETKEEMAQADRRSLRVEVPIASNGTLYATLTLSKSLKHGNDDRFVLRRVEYLRRTITSTMEKFGIRLLTCPELLEDRRHPDNHTARAWNGHERRSLHLPQ